MVIEPRYFAVADPVDPGRMTYWRRDGGGRYRPWPAKARYGPDLWRDPGEGREHVIPAGLGDADRKRWLLDWAGRVSGPWHAQVQAAIEADPAGAAARFAALRCCCACCGRKLKDPTGRTYGVGPECRDGWPADRLAAAVEAVGRAHAEILTVGSVQATRVV